MNRLDAGMGGALILATAAYFVWPASGQRPGAQVAAPPAPAATAAAPNGGAHWGASPFAAGAPPPRDSGQAQRIAERRRRMAAGNYQTPETYFHMTIAELEVRGREGDVSALLQLGERYWSEPPATLEGEGGKMVASTRRTALDYFAYAARGGALQVVTAVADRVREGGDPVEAAAWDMVARQTRPSRGGTDIGPSGLNPAQQGAAQARARAIAQQIGIVL